MKKNSDNDKQLVKSPSSEIVEKVLSDALVNGFAFRSLRDVAATSGISHRMLIYHFGSHYGLWTAIIREVRAVERELFEAETSTVNTMDELAEFFIAFWRRYTTEQFCDFYQLHFELYSYALRHREEFTEFLEGVVEPWLESMTYLFVRVGFTEEAATDRARIMLAAMRGFSLDFITTRDEQQIEHAGRTLLNLICTDPNAIQ